jgi:O-antigen ligase
MAKKKRNSAIPNVTPTNVRHTQAAKVDVNDDGPTGVNRASNKGRASISSYTAPAEVAKGDWTVLILSLMMFFAPALGVPHEEMLQDTLKSIVVSFATLMALLLFFWGQRNRRDALRWHFIVLLPVMLMLYGLGSMVWAHTYLAGVEAIRWFIFVLIVWLGLNTFSRDRLIWLAWGVHWGAFVTSLWAALQFWFDFKYFPQGPNPASTFVNRNFFAEYVVCTLPFSALLLAHTKKTPGILVHSFTLAFIIVSLMMTGTRGALGSMWLELFIILPIIIFIYEYIISNICYIIHL